MIIVVKCQVSSLSTSSAQLGLVLFPETVACRERVPAPPLVHVPHVGLLPRVVALVLVDEVHQEEQVVGEVVFLLDVSLEAVRDLVQVVFTDAADETVPGQLVLHALQLVTERTEGVNDETLDDGEEDEGDEQEEREVEENPDVLIVGPVWRLDDVTDASTSSDSLVEMEHEAGENVVTLLVGVLPLLPLRHVELAEEVEGEDGVDVADDGEEPHGEDQLLAVVGDGLEDDPEG